MEGSKGRSRSPIVPPCRPTVGDSAPCLEKSSSRPRAVLAGLFVTLVLVIERSSGTLGREETMLRRKENTWTAEAGRRGSVHLARRPEGGIALALG